MTWVRRGVGLAVATCVATLACFPTGPVGAAGAETSLDLLPEQLLEPPPANETQRLLAEGRRTTAYCTVLANLDGLRPPNPEKINELVVFGQAYHQNTTFLDRRSTVRDPEARAGDTDRKIKTPDEVVAMIEVERAAMYAFYSRMLSARTLRRSDLIDDDALERRVRLAFMKLMSSGFAEADRSLQESRPRYCG